MALLESGEHVTGGSYVVERLLGQGAYSEVYRVRHAVLGRLAMKVLRKVGTLAQTHRLLGEAVLLSRIGHPNVVRVFDAGTVTTAAGERGWFTMEYVAGGNLDDFRTAHTSGPVPDTVEVLTQICAGLATAHAEDPPIVHRDLTPWNILVGEDRHGIRVRIGDFGLARRTHPDTGLASGEGTLAFMAPEALRYGIGSSTAADVYSIGVLAYLLLTDVLPHRDLAHTVYGADRREAPVAPSRFNHDVDAALDRLVLSTLDPAPLRRPPDATALGVALAAWQAGDAAGTARRTETA